MLMDITLLIVPVQKYQDLLGDTETCVCVCVCYSICTYDDSSSEYHDSDINSYTSPNPGVRKSRRP